MLSQARFGISLFVVFTACSSDPEDKQGSAVAPILTGFTVSTAAVVVGTPTEVKWSWSYEQEPTPAPTCTIDQGVGELTNGSSTTVTLSNDTIYTLTCTNSAGEDTAQATITTVSDPVAPEFASFTANPAALADGTPTEVTWSWSYEQEPTPAPTCTIDQGVGELTSGSSTTVTQSSETTYTLTCTNSAGEDTALTIVTVQTTGGVISLAAGWGSTCALLSSGGVKCWGAGGTPVDVAGLTSGVKSISVSAFHKCALLSSGGLKCWGKNKYGQLGDGTTTASQTPVDVSGLSSGVVAVAAGGAGVVHTCALLFSGGVKCWGNNRTGQLGDGTTTDRHTPVSVFGLTSGVTSIAAGGYGENHTCALLTDGNVKCWGDNFSGQLGDGTTIERHTPVDVTGLSSSATAVVSAAQHTCALLTGGALNCWGSNWYGELGDGTTIDRHTPIQVPGLASGVTAVVAGDHYRTCVLLSSGGVQCWGWNEWGQIGDGTTTDRHSPVPVSGLSSGVKSIHAGLSHTCAILTNGGVKCWGEGYGSTPVDIEGL